MTTLNEAISAAWNSNDIYETMTASAFGTVINKGSLPIRTALNTAPASMFVEVVEVARANRFGNIANIIRFIKGEPTSSIVAGVNS